MTVCERCGKQNATKTVYNTQKPSQQSKLCEQCVKIVIRANTAWQIKGR